ncbi:MAG: hypothetical protein J5508_07735 [Bacteroidales bacterium]|jgi:hypothetical protein|nr:hypothetical protein [Bacteroidales bacterium]MBR5670444.1 hypothetical protein [Bacteroidales bacterium]
MKRIAIPVLAILVLLLAVPAAAQDGARRYGVKSGIIKLIASTGGVDTPETQYFDDYGRKESLTYTTEIPGLVKYDSWVIAIGDKMWGVNVTDGKRTKGKESQNPTYDLNFINPSPEVIAKYNIKELGEEQFLGRKCKKFNYDITQGRNKITYTAWVYKGIILKQQGQVRRREVITYATEFQENVAVPASAFQIED